MDELKALLRHRIHYLLSVEVGIQRADESYPEIDALLDDLTTDRFPVALSGVGSSDD